MLKATFLIKINWYNFGISEKSSNAHLIKHRYKGQNGKKKNNDRWK